MAVRALQALSSRTEHWEAEMRKEDRIRQQQNQNPSEHDRDMPEPRPSERITGRGPEEQAQRPPQKPGPRPLPD